MGTRDDILDILASEARGPFLLALIREMALRGRGWYVAAGRAVAESVDGLQCMNELVLAVSEQLRSDESGFPDEVFLANLEGKAAVGGCLVDFRIAVVQAQESIGS